MLVESLANQDLDDGLTADIQFFRRPVQLVQHRRREIHIRTPNWRQYAAGIREES
jgi:hypothetical protein